MPGKFEIYKDNAGEFRFRLKAANGNVLLASEGYGSIASAKKGAAAVQANCESATAFVKATTESGKFRFNMKAKNNQVIGTSQNYDSEASRDAGIAAVASAAMGAEVVDLGGEA